jgi:phosphocarrier protein HPr
VIAMPQQRVLIGSSVGLHARPASLFVQTAARQPVRVKIAKGDGDPVDARSILSVLALDARHGDEVVLTAEGEGAGEALAALAALLEQDLDQAETPQPAGEARA